MRSCALPHQRNRNPHADVATQLEMPFGRSDNDVDFEKMVRRIDKHTAAQERSPHSEPAACSKGQPSSA